MRRELRTWAPMRNADTKALPSPPSASNPPDATPGQEGHYECQCRK